MSHLLDVMLIDGEHCVCFIRYIVFLQLLYPFLLNFYKYSTILLMMQVVQGIISGSYNMEMLAISSAAIHSSCQVKVRLLFILMETLDLENLLQMVHDQTTLRLSSCLLKLIYFGFIGGQLNKDVLSFFFELCSFYHRWNVKSVKVR